MRDWVKWLIAVLAALLVWWVVRWGADQFWNSKECKPPCGQPGPDPDVFVGCLYASLNGVPATNLYPQFIRNAVNTLTFRNGGNPETVKSIKIFQCVDGVHVDVGTLKPKCRYVVLKSTTCLEGTSPKPLAGTATCDVVIDQTPEFNSYPGNPGLRGHVVIETDAGTTTLPFDIHP